MLEIILSLSLIFNITFLLYTRWLIKITRTNEEDFRATADIISQYVSHVSGVHEMEMFYGDPTLGNLITHGREIVDKINTLDYIVLEEGPVESNINESEGGDI
tara:strand:+ start:657 stop:965 length:309 start_codon:yes stop_codon:yes gene_type:complete